MKYLLDTNIYIEACRSEKERARFRITYFPLLPATFLSAVVAYELYVNAQDRRTRSLVQEFIGPSGFRCFTHGRRSLTVLW